MLLLSKIAILNHFLFDLWCPYNWNEGSLAYTAIKRSFSIKSSIFAWLWRHFRSKNWKCVFLWILDVFLIQTRGHMPWTLKFEFSLVKNGQNEWWRHFRSKKGRSRLVPGSFGKLIYQWPNVPSFSLFWRNAGWV